MKIIKLTLTGTVSDNTFDVLSDWDNKDVPVTIHGTAYRLTVTTVYKVQFSKHHEEATLQAKIREF